MRNAQQLVLAVKFVNIKLKLRSAFSFLNEYVYLRHTKIKTKSAFIRLILELKFKKQKTTMNLNARHRIVFYTPAINN
jgi:hypothetical protein